MIYICIPAHNEAQTIGPLIWKVRKVMREFDRAFEVVVLDDSSTDSTHQVVQRYRANVPLRIIHSHERLGYGTAVTRLLADVAKRAQYPKRDAAIVLQADLTEDPEDLVSLVKGLEGGSDIVAGVRGELRGELSRGHRVARWVAPYLLGRTQKEAPVSDLLSGLRLYRVIVLKKALREELPDVTLRGTNPWSINIELMQALAPFARRITEVPVAFRPGLLVRETRFNSVTSLRDVVRYRGHDWGEARGNGRAA